jgi:hypothetical protein
MAATSLWNWWEESGGSSANNNNDGASSCHPPLSSSSITIIATIACRCVLLCSSRLSRTHHLIPTTLVQRCWSAHLRVSQAHTLFAGPSDLFG